MYEETMEVLAQLDLEPSTRPYQEESEEEPQELNFDD